MPEITEVEAARRAVEEHCVGKKIKKAIVADDSKVIDGVSPSHFQSSLVGKTIISARRKGKNMWLQLDSPPSPSFQFGMAGAIYIKGVAVTKYKRSAVNDTDEWPSKYSKVFIELDDGLEFSFTDKRRFAKVRLLDNPELVPPISELGPDALFEPKQEDEFVDSLTKKKIAIKALLLDQSFIAGIGNWIADEVLYQARIHPLQTTASLPKEKCRDLLKCINEVIQYAVEVDDDSSRFPIEWLFHFRWEKKAGKVIEKALDVGADSSQFPSNWIFHSREKKPGKAFVDGRRIEFITAGGRTSAFVPELQKLTGVQAGKLPSKPAKKFDKGESGSGEDEVEEGQTAKPNERERSKGNHGANNEGPPKKTSKVAANKKVKTRHDSDDDDEPKKVIKMTQKKRTKEMKTVEKGVKINETSAREKKRARK
ncbi:hypothetical protein AAC387_Pa03g0530 [Persea americana]